MKKTFLIILSLLAICGIALFIWSHIISDVDEPKYIVIADQDKIQLREYHPMILAQVYAQGARDTAINQGFRALADYIFGNNSTQKEIAMTAPVSQTSTKIAMTAPVSQQQADDGWIISFVMPVEYSLETLPKPNNPQIQIKQIAQRKVATIRFSGWVTDSKLSKYEQQLHKYIKQNNLQPVSKPIYAFYNPPWSLPFLKRHEIMIEVQ